MMQGMPSAEIYGPEKDQASPVSSANQETLRRTEMIRSAIVPILPSISFERNNDPYILRRG